MVALRTATTALCLLIVFLVASTLIHAAEPAVDAGTAALGMVTAGGDSTCVVDAEGAVFSLTSALCSR